MYKTICVFLTAILLSFSSLSSMSKAECQTAAEQIYSAQGLLNVSPEVFKQTHALVQATPAEEMGVTQELKDFIVSLANKLKPGMDPQSAGMATYQGCLAKLKAA